MGIGKLFGSREESPLRVLSDVWVVTDSQNGEVVGVFTSEARAQEAAGKDLQSKNYLFVDKYQLNQRRK